MRPTKQCARCVRNLLPGCEHLANTYDRCMLKGMTEQDLIEYALNRILALGRDNGNKAEGLPASRNYRSRNERAARVLANLCGAPGPRDVRCIRTAGHEGPHKF